MFPRRRLSLLVLPLLLAGLPPALIGQEEGLPPAFLRDHALVVRFLASAYGNLSPASGEALNGGASAPSLGPAPATSPGQTPPQTASSQTPQTPNPTWSSHSLRYTMSGTPVAIRLAGDDLVVVVQITPYDHGREGLLLVAQGQVWRRDAAGKFDYRSAFESLAVGWGESVYFYPLGRREDGAAPISLRIAVDRFGDSPSIPDKDQTPPSRGESGSQGQNPLPSPGPSPTPGPNQTPTTPPSQGKR